MNQINTHIDESNGSIEDVATYQRGLEETEVRTSYRNRHIADCVLEALRGSVEDEAVRGYACT